MYVVVNSEGKRKYHQELTTKHILIFGPSTLFSTNIEVCAHICVWLASHCV